MCRHIQTGYEITNESDPYSNFDKMAGQMVRARDVVTCRWSSSCFCSEGGLF